MKTDNLDSLYGFQNSYFNLPHKFRTPHAKDKTLPIAPSSFP